MRFGLRTDHSRGSIRDYNAVMHRATLLTLVASALLLAAPLEAQRAGGMVRGGGRGVGGGRGAGTAVMGRSGFRGGHDEGNSRGRRFRSDAFLYPWYDEPLDYEQPAVADESAPPMMMVPPSRSRFGAPLRIPASPKITELPGAASAEASKPLPPAMFILNNGERIEAQQYLLTYDHVHLTVGREQRTIPLAMLDLNATLAADRQRGIDLRVPAGRGEISLGF
jgi:hypothetical protein